RRRWRWRFCCSWRRRLAASSAWGSTSSAGIRATGRPRPGRASMTVLSVVIPIKDEVDNLRPLHDRLVAALHPPLVPPASTPLADYELLFIDDGSTDGSVKLLDELASQNPRVKVVYLRRNYGQTPALRAGIDFSRGDVLVTMDGDLQNDPADIPRLLEVLEQG